MHYTCKMNIMYFWIRYQISDTQFSLDVMFNFFNLKNFLYLTRKYTNQNYVSEANSKQTYMIAICILKLFSNYKMLLLLFFLRCCSKYIHQCWKIIGCCRRISPNWRMQCWRYLFCGSWVRIPHFKFCPKVKKEYTVLPNFFYSS